MRQLDSSPDIPAGLAVRARHVAEFWNSYNVTGDPGASTREVLEGIERQVSDCMSMAMQAIGKAESLTAIALGLMSGHENL